MTTLLALLVMVFAAHRITRVITRDKLPIIHQPREKFQDRWMRLEFIPDDVHPYMTSTGKPSNVFMDSISYLWSCDWCMGVWISGMITLAAYREGLEFPAPGWMVWLAVASGVGFLAERETRS